MDTFRVMIVDDDPDIRFVLANLLKPRFEVVEAENGLDALEKVERYQPDLMLLDVGMPIMNGFQCCEGVRRHPQYQRLPVFFLSGYSDRDTYAEAYGSGATAFLEKPVDTSQLNGLIETHIRERKTQPNEKTFTVEELHVVDRTPLRQSGAPVPRPGPSLSPHLGKTPPEPESTTGPRSSAGKPSTRRRVFGRGSQGTPSPPTPPASQPPQPAPPPAPAAPPEELQPPPIEPRYGRVDQPRPVAGPASRRKNRTSASPSPETGAAPVPPTIARENVASPPPASGPAPPVSPSPNGTKPEPPVQPRVMVINSDPKDMVEFARAVQVRGEFMPLEDPVEAIELVARFQPDIVLCPVRMKGWEGLDFIQMIRTNPRLAHIRVVFSAEPGEDPARRRVAEQESGFSLIDRPPAGERISELLDRVMSAPGFVVRVKRATYSEYVRDVIRKIDSQKESRRRLREREAHQRHMAGWSKFLATELKDCQTQGNAVAESRIRDYYLS